MRGAVAFACATALALSLAACKKDEAATEPAGPKVEKGAPPATPGGPEWPALPADGAPVAVEFVAMARAGEDLRATMRVFNFGDQAVRGVHLELEYLGADGAVIKSFPWSQVAPSLVEAKAHSLQDMGAFIPAETASVRAVVKRVELTDGSDWRPADAP